MAIENLNIANDIRQAAIDYYSKSIQNKTNFEKIQIWKNQLNNFKVRYEIDKNNYNNIINKIKYINIPYASDQTNTWLNFRDSKINSSELSLRQIYLETFLQGYYLIQHIRDDIVKQFKMNYTLGFSVEEEGKQIQLKEKTVSLEDFYKGVNLDKSGTSLQASLGAQLKNALGIAKKFKALTKIPQQANNHKTLFGQIFGLFNEENPLGIWAYQRGIKKQVMNYTNKGRAFQVYRRVVATRRRNIAISDFDTLAQIAISVYSDNLQSITGGDWLQQQLKYFGTGQGKVSLISEKQLDRVISTYLNIFNMIEKNQSSRKIKNELSRLINQQITDNSTYAEKVLINKINNQIDQFINEINKK